MSGAVEALISEERTVKPQQLSALTIQDELLAIFESAPFRKSEQSRNFLKYIVKQTLSGNTEALKERVIGIEVFRRPSDYDTSTDPIVRSRATDVRKRLAQYYVGEGAHAAIRIELSPGSYQASFSCPSELTGGALDPGRAKDEFSRSISEISVDEAVDLPDVASAKLVRSARIQHLSSPVLWGVAALAITAISFLWFQRASAIDQFWKPLFGGAKPLLIYTGSVKFGNTYITVGDLSASVRTASLFSRDGEKFDIRAGDDITFDDLRQFPAVLIGCLNNHWTMAINDDLQFGCLDDKVPMIEERSGARRQWTSIRMPDGTLQVDYALVTRLISSKTGQPLVAIAGITDTGTRAAAEFITSSSKLTQLTRSAPKQWENQNMQFVLQTKVINNTPSTSTVVAVRYW